jgi:hypothetical protein
MTVLHGIHQARGAFVSICGQDDIMFPSRISTLIKMLDTTNCSMACSNAFYLNGNEPTDLLLRPKSKEAGYLHSYQFLFNNPVVGSTALFRREHFERIDLAIFRFRQAMEWIHWFEYTQMAGVYYLETPLIYYRKHSRNLTNQYFHTTEFRRYQQYCRRRIFKRLNSREIILAIIERLGERS